jgi:hypothetical protein
MLLIRTDLLIGYPKCRGLSAAWRTESTAFALVKAL